MGRGSPRAGTVGRKAVVDEAGSGEGRGGILSYGSSIMEGGATGFVRQKDG